MAENERGFSMADFTSAGIRLPDDVMEQCRVDAEECGLPVEGIVGLMIAHDAVTNKKVDESTITSAQKNLERIADYIEENGVSLENAFEIAATIRNLSQYASVHPVLVTPIDRLDLV